MLWERLVVAHYYIMKGVIVSHNIQIRNENLFLISCEGEQPCGILLFGSEGGREGRMH